MAELKVPITKGKASVTINTDDIPDAVYQEALLQGLKVLLNRGASKITKETYPADAELQAAAMAKAQEQVELVRTGKIKFTGQKASAKASGAVMTEARRLARNLVKDALKQAGHKISHYEAAEITKAANALLDQDASILETAKANLEARSAKPIAIDVSALVQESPKLVAKAAKAAAEKKAAKAGQLSATQAGKVDTRKKPAAQPTMQ